MIIPPRVVIVGGTHGNESTGIQIVRSYQDHFLKKFPSLKLEFLLANPKAHSANCRFIDEDLNRAFAFLDEKRSSYEHLRAHEIKNEINRSPCLVIDLHTTTSNMGNSVIVSHYNPLNLSICSKLAHHFKDVRIIGAPDPQRKYLASQSDFGLILEIGPVANGVVQAVPLESTVTLIEFVLAQLIDPEIISHGNIELYEEDQDIGFPRDEKGELKAYIHSGFQGQDFQSLEGEFVPFKSFAGEEIRMKTVEKMFPIFINEAAYYEKNLAFTLCKKVRVKF